MPNEVTIAVTMVDETAATKAEIKSGIQEWAAGIGPIPVTASSPIDEAWQAQVAADVKATDPGEVVVPVSADTEAVAAEVEAARAQVEAAVEPVIIPVEAEQSPSSFRPSAMVAGGAYGAGGDPYAAARASIAEQQAITVPVVAADPITDAWKAQLAASIKSITADAVKIPVGADTAAFQQQVQEQLAELVDVRANVPVDAANLPEFRAEVTEQARSLSQMVKVVVDVDPNTTSLAELRANILGAADASQAEVKAQQELAAAMQAANADGSAKNAAALARAEVDAAQASEMSAKAQDALAESMKATAGAEDVAAGASRGLGAAMGPLWMLMNVAQLAMFAFGSSSSSTATQVQDASQQIIQLGQSAGTAASSLVAGNQNLQGMSGDLQILGTNTTQFAQQYTGSIDTATQYTNRLATEFKNLGNQKITFSDADIKNLESVMGEGGATVITASTNVKQLKEAVDSNKEALAALSPPLRTAVDEYSSLHDIVPQAQDSLTGMKMAAEQNKDTLAALGYVMTDGQTVMNQYGLTVQTNAKALSDATSGARYLEDSVDKASIAAGQGAQQWAQLQAAVASAGQQVESASHSIVTAEQGVESARHSQAQATLAVTAAQQGYSNTLYQQKQAQDAVTASEAAAEQQMISLKLQAADAAASAQSSNLSLYRATQAAAQVGVNAGNEQAFASLAPDQINAANEAQVAAADALIQAQNQVADAANSSATAQSSLNTARQQGVANNPAVLAAEHAVDQVNQAVQTSAQGVTNSQWAQQQAAIAVGNAQWGVVSAEQGLATAEANLTTARDATSRSLDANTLQGAENRQMIETLYIDYRDLTGNQQIAAQMTETAAGKMGFLSGKVADVIANVQGLNGMSALFSIEGVPSLDPSKLAEIGNDLHMSFTDIENALPGPGQAGYHSAGRAQAVGGPGGGLTWVGEGGPELVDLPHGTEVLTNANSMMMVASGDVLPPGHASGGPVGADAVLAANLPLAAQWGALDTVGQMLHALGGPAVSLPSAGNVDWGAFGGMSGSVPGGPSSAGLSGDRAANKAIMQQVFAGFGWGSGAEWAAQDYVEMREAGYNNLAQNPHSTAFGMGQLLDSSWAGTGIAKTADPYLQSVAMARYEGARYGGPIGAAAHEKAFNWYGGGGPASGVVGVGDRGPELARLPGGSAGIGGAAEVRVVMEIGSGVESGFASWFKQLVRTGQIRFTTNGSLVAVG